MESYLKSWKNVAKFENREHSDFLQNYNSGMTNSFKPEDGIKEKVYGNESGPDSLPIYCIIQTISSLQDFNEVCFHDCDKKKNNETGGWWQCDCRKSEMSGCVMVPEDTSINDLVKTVLVKLGYPNCASSFAAGSILIRNWKPLSLETVCPGKKKSVADIFGELTSIVSLRIQIFCPRISILQKIKDNLLSFLIKTNQNFLRDSGCPFDTKTLFKFCDSDNYLKKQLLQEPTQDLQQKFDAWLKHHLEIEKDSEKCKTQLQSSSLINNYKIADLNGNSRESPSSQRQEMIKSETAGKLSKEPFDDVSSELGKEPSSFSVVERSKSFLTTKTRVRTSFDPEFELPKLQKWYSDNPHPSRQQIYEYVTELNSLESRKGRKQLDLNNVVYWFKNARAAQKRTECRKILNVPTSGANACNVLKIPLGKGSGVASDDQRSISDDEVSIASEHGDDFKNENGRCLQVVGRWNSNGQGEAVLEMHIASSKNEYVQSVMFSNKNRLNEDEETSRSGGLSTDEDSVDPVKRQPIFDKKDFLSGAPEKALAQKENQALNVMENNKTEMRNREEMSNNEGQSNGIIKNEEVSLSKMQTKNEFTSYKENNGVVSSAFLSSYKSGFSVTPNSILGHSFGCMSQYMNPKQNSMPLSSEERRKRNRTFIDPVTEVPRLEQWFRLSTHPSHNLIARYTDELNNMPYRRKFPKLEAKNVQFWFKNRRAKNKRLNYMECSNN